MSYYKNKLTKLGLIFSSFLILTIFSNCSSDLNIQDPNRLSPDVFWRNATDAEAGLTAVYASLPSIPAYGRIGLSLMLMQRSDEVDPFPQINVNDGGNFNATPDLPRLNEPWGEFYKQVSAANQVLANVPDIDMDATRKSQILAETRFLRASAYFYLVNNWGNIPLILNEITEADQLFVGNSTPDEVFDAMIADLSDAQGDLPQSWSADQVGRATSGAATALLGKCYLYTNQWAAAAAEFKKIIDSGEYSLPEDYFDNFREETTNNSESIFEIQYDGNETGNWGGAGTPSTWRGQAWEADLAPRAFSSQQSVTINQFVFDLFMDQQTVDGGEDPRAKATMVWNYPGAMMYKTAFTEAFSGVDLERIWVRKYLNFENDTALAPGSWVGDTNNWRMIRYADVLLMYAEAINESEGAEQEAFDAINEVRARSNMPAYSGMDQSTLREAIRDERVRELAVEGHRWWDLLRWGIAAERFQNNDLRSNSGGQFVTNKHEYFPLPRRDVDGNPNLNQNPGY